MAHWAYFRMRLEHLFALFTEIVTYCSAVDACSWEQEIYEGHKVYKKSPAKTLNYLRAEDYVLKSIGYFMMLVTEKN